MPQNEIYQQAEKEMDALKACINKKVKVYFIRHGKPFELVEYLVELVPYCSIFTSKVNSLSGSVSPFIGLSCAILKITDEKDNILYQNTTEFSSTFWEKKQMNIYREKKWGTSKYNLP
ncbi:MAG: hypothetical protein WCL02_02300 [bacterium]